MKVLLLNGSPNPAGCTFTSLNIIKEQLATHGVTAEIHHIGSAPVQGCTNCGGCRKAKQCVFDDQVNELARKLNEADGMVIGSPVYYASANGALTALLDRLFFSTPVNIKRMKFGACIVNCRRGGNSAAFDQLNKYFTISEMPVVSSCYWNGTHGFVPEELLRDEEGVRILKVLANNMAYLIRCKHAAALPLPEKEPFVMTHFVS
ncbi:MAG: flavodoxin family protein [Oscillospiraceae bacterium]|nr:flavodoxin family protein [Oscillospiraceae bacterium]